MKDRIITFKERLASKKGVTSIEVVMSVLIVIIVISGFVDLTGILRRGNAVSTNTAYVSRVVGNQGGIQTREVPNFSGRYVNSNELYTNVQRSMRSSGIADNEWEVHIYGVPLSKGMNLPVYDYGSRIPIVVSVDYKWGFTENFVPGNIRGTHTSKNTVVTTHKIRNSSYRQN